MGTTSDKLTYLNETKTQIKNNLNFGGANITNETFRQYADKIKDLYVYFMNNGLDVVWNNWEKVIGSGTSITLNQTMEAPMKIDLKGNTSQNGTPTPSSPIEVETTTGRQVVSVSDGTTTNDYEINLGKNLFSSEMEFGSIDNTTGESVANSNCIRSVDYIRVKPNTTYTISSTMDYHVLVHQYKADKTYIQYDGNYYSPRTFTTTANTYYIRVRSGAGQVENNIHAKYQLELGSSATNYSPYKSPIELCKIGTYQDYIYKENGDWYIHKEIGKYIYNNEGSVNTPKTNYYNVSGLTNPGWINTLDTNNYLSTEYPSASVQSTDGNFQNATANMDYAFGLHTNGQTIRFKDSRGLSASDFKTDLIGTEIYFALVTPTNTLITDYELINQLNELEKAKGYDNTTNIIQANDNLPFILDVRALKKI